MTKRKIHNKRRQNSIPLDLETVRKLAVVKQGLHERPKKITRSKILALISRIGMLQLDSVNVVQRSHYIVLFSRLGIYGTDVIDKLQHPAKKVIEQWVHVASLITIGDFVNFGPEILSRRNKSLSNRQLRVLGSDYKHKLDETLRKIKISGPIASNRFKGNNPNKNSWWSKKPARVALDVLFRRGYIAVPYRKNFQCYYDLQERIAKIGSPHSLSACYKWIVIKAIDAMGVASIDQICDYYRVDKKSIERAVNELKRENKIKIVHVVGIQAEMYTTYKNILIGKKILQEKIKCKLTTVLSPFDNLIWNRDRTEMIFDFYYRSEMYVPSGKRKFGYYALPILHDGKLIGRLDPKFKRESKELTINRISLEDSTRYSLYTIKCVANAITDFARFLGAENITFRRTSTDKVLTQIKERVSMYSNSQFL